MSRRIASQPPELPGLRFERLLGSGGFSDVFLYEQQLPKRMVAVKVMLADELDASARRAFVDEANLMARLSAHPYIVTIFHADFAADGRPYLMMEYCSGPSLAERYKRERLAVPDVLRTGVRISGAVATAHAAGILHRDIKPANVLSNDFGWPALTDFGIASTIDDELPVHTTTGGALLDTGSSTGSQSVGMSVPWSPPEMFEEKPQPDARSDVFSLAATLHTLLAGRTPFEIAGRSNGVLDLIGRIERGTISPLDRGDVPRSLVAVLAKGMASRRSDRYDTVIDFARALQRVELELGYSPTSIDVPTVLVEQAIAAVDDAADDPDATSFRSVSTIAAQPVDAAPAGPSRPAGQDRPAAADAETVLRGVTEIAQPTAGAAPATVGGLEQTVLRPAAIANTAPPPAAPTTGASAASTASATPSTASVMPPAPEGDTAAAQSGLTASDGPRRPGVAALVVVAALVLLAGGVVAALLLGGGSRDEAEPTPEPSGDSAIIGGQVPTPEFERVRRDGQRVTFSWSNPDAQEGDVYRWALAESPNDQRTVTESKVTVTRPSAGARVCVEVVILRAGRVSAVPMERCDPE